MPSTRQGKLMTKNDIDSGLAELDAAIAESSLLMSVAPIRFVTMGGMLATAFFQNRHATKDIDVLIDPNVDAVVEYRSEVLRVIQSVGRRKGFTKEWMNDELKIFIQTSNRLPLFLKSVEQDIIAFQGANIVVYAARLDFALERKLRRVAEADTARVRGTDLSDAVALVHYLKSQGDGHPLSWEYVASLDENQLGMGIARVGITQTAAEYERVHGAQGIVHMVQDEENGGERYRDMDGAWVWV